MVGNDDFIEVHFYGRMNILTVEKVIYVNQNRMPASARLRRKQAGKSAELVTLKERLRGYNVTFEEVRA